MNKEEFIKLFGTPFTLKVLYDIHTHPETTKYGVITRTTYGSYDVKQHMKRLLHELGERGLITGFTCYKLNPDHPVARGFAEMFSQLEE